MKAAEAYSEFNKLEKRLDEVKTIYTHLKSDINVMSDSQIKWQSQKILNRISKIDLNSIEQYLETLKSYLIYDNIKNRAEEMMNKIKEIKNFIYSLKEDKDKIHKDDSIEQSTPRDKKLDYIRDKYIFLQKQIEIADTETVIKDAKRLENQLARLNFEDLPEGDYDEMVNIKNDVSKMINTLQGIEKSEKYGPYIKEPLIDLIANHITLGNREKAESKAAGILNFIEDPNRIEMFEPAIKRIIAKKMTPKEFKIFYDSISVMYRGNKKFESFENYKFQYEFFYLL